MEKYYSYFAHEKCEYFPCHKGANSSDFNCLFCYCPLYVLGENCGGNYRYLSNGTKDCSECLFPHFRLNYEAVTQRFQEIVDKMNQDSTIAYYDEHAEDFAKNTKDVNFHDMQERFLRDLNTGARILDFGCGAGRDTKYFLEKGYQVDALDGSKKLCEIAEKNTGISVICQRFESFYSEECYDGIWACASLLHLPMSRLEVVLQNLSHALKKDGRMYLSFKYGTSEGERNGRYFTDMTKEKFMLLLYENLQLKIEDEWISADVRSGRENEKWWNIILIKCTKNKKMY